MKVIRALIRRDPKSGRLVAWVPRLMPEARCESDDYEALQKDLECTVRAELERRREPGSALQMFRIETASVM